MKSTELHFVRDAAAAVLWRIEDMVEAGATFAEAKKAAIAQAKPSWRWFPEHVAQGIEAVAESLQPGDMSRRTRRIAEDRSLQAIEEGRGRPAGYMERLLYRLTGYVY